MRISDDGKSPDREALRQPLRSKITDSAKATQTLNARFDTNLEVNQWVKQ
jgi:hypothetical protein